MKKDPRASRGIERPPAKSEKQFRTLYLRMPIPSLTWQKQGRDFILIGYNQAAEEFTDGKIVDHLGKKASRVYADQPGIRRDMARSFRIRGVVRRESHYRMFTRGIDKIIDFTFAFVPPDLVLSHMTDNTERRMTERMLLQSERELRQLSTRLLHAGEQERKRIAAELHDSVGQYLTTLKFNAENTLSQLQSGNREAAVKLLEAGIPLVKQTLEEVRRIMMDLRPTILDDLGILATISWFCREFQSVYGNLRIRTAISLREPDVPEHLKIVIFRILQESMNNAARHSGATDVLLRLVRKGDRIELTVRDNGSGFDMGGAMAGQVRHHGLGLIGMRERAELGGGRLTVESAVGRGTTVRARWPVEKG